jgi:hypothetical protein
MIEGTAIQSRARVSLPVGIAGRDLLLPSDLHGFYFSFTYFSYTPVVGRWAALGRCAR